MKGKQNVTRRAFLAATTVASATAFQGSHAMAAKPRSRTAGANDRIGVGVVGCGQRGREHLRKLLRLAQEPGRVEVSAVCDACEPRRRHAQALSGARACARWEDLVVRGDLDAVLVATPDHQHAVIAVGAMEAGKDVYCERPMALSWQDAKAFRDVARATGRVVQIGVEQTSDGQWQAARELIRSGAIGMVRWCQATAKVNARGEATAMHYGALAPLLVAVGPAFPRRVSATGGVYDGDGREVPDTLVSRIEYDRGHTIVLVSPMAHAKVADPVIRGTEASIEFRGHGVHVSVDSDCDSETRLGARSAAKDAGTSGQGHLENWVACMRTRQACACSPELGYMTQVACSLSIEAYRQGRALYFDAAKQEVSGLPAMSAGHHE